MAKGGYTGKFLRVDLCAQRVRDEYIPEKALREFIGGRGLGVYLMLKYVDPKVEPLSPHNKLLFLTGPVTATGVPMSGRWCTVTKSPLTYTIHDSHAGGHFGVELKFAGYDGIIVEGASETPVYLWIHDGKAEIRDAKHLWGKTVFDTVDTLREELGDEKIQVASIGPAGENLVRFACIMDNKTRAAGRGGHGAVMGSKKLKAVAARGTSKPKVADEEKFREAVRTITAKLNESPVTKEALPTYGTAVLVNVINEHGIFPTKNFQTGVFPTAGNISGETIREKILVKADPCWGCPVKCGRYTRIKEPSPYAGEGGGPEYETVWAFGAQTGTDNLEAVTRANWLCNELGLDTISMGHVIGTAMELAQRGKIPDGVFERPLLTWGNPEALVELTIRTAYRIGLGDDIAEGAKRLAEKYGAPEVAMVVRGQELPAYDPRGAKGHGLAYATSNRGGCHLRAYMIAPEVLKVPKEVDRFATDGEKAKLVKVFQDGSAVEDSLVVCRFITFALWLEELAPALSAVTGWEYTADDLAKVGERIWNAERAFNALSFGDGVEYDTLPRRLLEEPMPEGPAKGHVVELKPMLNEYYKARGWVDGRPTRAKLEELGLKWLADRLEEEGLLPA